MEEDKQNDSSRIRLVVELITELVVSRKKLIEDELRACGRSLLARMVHQLPFSEPEQLEKIAVNDLPVASGALAMAAASSCILHATQGRFKDACRSADMALIMIGMPVGQPLLDFIVLNEQDLLSHNSRIIKEGARFFEKSDSRCFAKKNMNAKCSEVTEGHFSVEDFSEFFKNDKPIVIRKLACSWPSVQKWCDPKYLGNRHGHRIVPIEYKSPSGRMEEKFSSLAEVIDMMTRKAHTEIRENIYMAQHPVLNYIPDLRNDVRTPQYLNVVGKTEADLVNLWMGSSGTGTKLHFDSADNILVQLVGHKEIVLIDPDQSHLLYQTNPNDNISPVDITKPDLVRFPRFAEAHGTTLRLEPGDGVYIPAQYWHWVRAISSSISINYWF
ncbi:unnamed protein product [Agarophyton chilense]